MTTPPLAMPSPSGLDSLVLTLFHACLGASALLDSAAASLGQWQPLAPQALLHDEPISKNNAMSSDHAVTSDICYKIVQIRGKGDGIVALRTIEPGEVILAEKTSLSLDGGPGNYIHLLWQLANLPATQQEAYFKLDPGSHRSTSNLPASLTIWRNNSFSISPNEQAVLPLVSKLNHACTPNVNIAWDEETATMSAVATRTITQGDEVVISYINSLLRCEQRKTRLRNTWGFECTCVTCTLPAAERQASDDLRVDIETTKHLLDRSSHDTDTQLLFAHSFSHRALRLCIDEARWTEASAWAVIASEHLKMANGAHCRVAAEIAAAADEPWQYMISETYSIVPSHNEIV